MTDSQRARTAHRTQTQRSEHTRGLLLDATIGCLVELGYARTSVSEICKRAGVSRGAQQHHFSTKADLMAKAIEHLAWRLSEEFTAGFDRMTPDADRVGGGIDLLWEAYSGDLSAAALELWVAARTDEELRAAMRPVDRALGRATLKIYATLAGLDPDSDPAQTVFWLTINLTRGLALEAEIGGDDARRHRQLDIWKRLVTGYLTDTPA